jgi:hypothetical protein
MRWDVLVVELPILLRRLLELGNLGLEPADAQQRDSLLSTKYYTLS